MSSPDTTRAPRPVPQPPVQPAMPAAPADPADAAGRLALLVHDLANLLDGSLRQLSLLSRGVHEYVHHARDHTELDGRLRTLRAALEHMARSLASAARGADLRSIARPVSGRIPGLGTLSIADALGAAAALARPRAAELSATIHTAVAPQLDAIDAGNIYSVVVNALANALDAFEAAPLSTAGQSPARAVHVAAGVEQSPWGPRAVITIADNGPGLHSAALTPEAPFAPGFTTKPHHLGLGLAISRQIITEAKGTISLDPGPGGVGAVLSIRLPIAIGPAEADAPRTGPR